MATQQRQRRKLKKEESALQLTDDQVNELKDCYEFLSKGKKDQLTKDDLKLAVAEMGLPAGSVEDMFKEADTTKSGNITFSQFLSLMSSRMMQVDLEDNLVGAFKIFDPEISGYISASKLQNSLTKMGEPLTPQEWLEFKESCIKGDQVDYMVFVNTLFAKKL